MRISEMVSYVDELGGVATAAQLKRAGFAPGLIDYAFRKGLIDKLTRGVYCTPDILDDDFAAVCARWRGCILSYGSALYMLGLSDRIPSVLDVTVPYGYNPRSLKEEYPGIRIHHVSPEIHGLGVAKVVTATGGRALSYDAERSIADLIKARAKNGVDAQLIRDAVRGYFKSEGRDLARLSRMCEVLGVRDELQVYLEVLV